MKTIFNNITDFQNAVKAATPKDTLELAPGVYDGSSTLDYRKPGKITVVMHGVTINGDPENKKQKYGLGVLGNNIDLLCDEIKLNGGNSGVMGILGHNLKIISDLTGYITGHNRGALQMGTNHHIEGLNFDGVGNVGISGKGFPIQDNMNRTYSQDFGWFPSHNWRVTRCIFQNIQPIESGDAGGGYRIIPHAKDVMVDNCLFRNIKGSGLWGDHNQKGFEWYYNIFEDIDTAEAFGKAMFLEIMDPDPNDKSGFVARIAGNIFRRCDTQTILIAASSGQNPGGIDIFGNIIEDGWGIIAGAMPRTFKRKWDFRNPGTHEKVAAKLENIRIRKNVIRNTTGRNHIALFQGVNSGLIEVDSNYYVTGHEYNYKRNSGVIETEVVESPQIFASKPSDNSLFVHGKSNAPHLDKNALIGSMPIVFPFPEAWDEIPVDRIPIGSIPNDDPVIIDPSPPSNNKPVWIFSDYSLKSTEGEYENDADDACSLAAGLIGNKKFGYEIKGITVGCYPGGKDGNQIYRYDDPKEQFLDNHIKGYGPIDFDVRLAYTHRTRFKNIVGTSEPIFLKLNKYSKENPLYLLNFGILTPIARAINGMTVDELKRVIVISHYTRGKNDNNRRKDEEAYQFLMSLKNQGKLKFIELDKAGAMYFDDDKPPKLAEWVLNTPLGKYFKEKGGRIPDISDFSACGVFSRKLGFGPEWINNAKMDGSSNLLHFANSFNGKQVLYDMIEDALSGDNGYGKSEVEELRDRLKELVKYGNGFLNAVAGEIVKFQEALDKI